MTRSRKKHRRSWLRRLVYLLVLVSGGGGGWIAKDHPRVQALWTLLTGKPAGGDAQDGDGAGSLARVAAALSSFHPAEDYRRPGTYQVTIPEVHLDPGLF